jgi:hypothetical protein
MNLHRWHLDEPLNDADTRAPPVTFWSHGFGATLDRNRGCHVTGAHCFSLRPGRVLVKERALLRLSRQGEITVHRARRADSLTFAEI